MTGESLAPQRRRLAIPAPFQIDKLGTLRGCPQRTHDRPGRVQLPSHPLHPHCRLCGCHLQRPGQIRARQFTYGFQPPQRQQLTVVFVEPPGRFGNLAALSLQTQPGDSEVHEVGPRIGDVYIQVGTPRRTAQGSPPPTHLLDRDRHQPRPETLRITQIRQPAQRVEHGFLHDIIDIGMPTHRPADDVVHQWQAPHHKIIDSRLAPTHRRGHHRGIEPDPFVHLIDLSGIPSASRPGL